MLEQAIVDATALRDAAIKSAEQVVVEQYSEQIKETVQQLLEQEEDPMAAGGGMDLGGGMDMGGGMDLGGGMDMGLGGEEGAAPGATGKVADDADTKFADKPGGVATQTMEAFYDALAEDVDEDTVLEIELDNLDYNAVRGQGKDKITPMREAKELEEASTPECERDIDCDDRDKDVCRAGKCVDLSAVSEDVSLDEELLEELAETLTMDYKDQPSGGFANGQMKPTNAFHDTQMVRDIAFAIEEYGEEQKEKNDKLQKENKQLKEKINFVATDNKKLIESVKLIKEKFIDVQLMNAKLFYTNQTLMDASLNERQKLKIVESINKVETIEQAKVVYDALQGSSASSGKKTAESLSEVVNSRHSSSILLRSQKGEKQNNNNDRFVDRMKRLAGIDKP